MRGLVRAALDLLFPPRCPACQAFTDENDFCPRCAQQLEVVRSPICPICGLPFRGRGPDHDCPVCRTRKRRFDRARSCLVYERDHAAESGPLAHVIHEYKYQHNVTLAPLLGNLLIERCPLTINHDIILPVPLHRDRLRWRGFNQSHLLARRLGRHCGVPVNPFALVRARPTPPQVGLNEADRRRNVAGAFAMRGGSSVAGRNALLVDDVYTTGATAEECARVLKRAGARRVDVLVLARVL